MAVTQNTLIGRSRGSVGGVTFTKWKGLNVIKAKPEEVENPRTEAQLTQRNRLSLMVALYRLTPAIFQVGFKEQAVNQSEYNAMVSENINSATASPTPPAVELIPSAFTISKGPLSATAIGTAASANLSADVVINYLALPTAPDQSVNDLAYALVYNQTQGVAGSALGTALRGDGTITVTLPAPADAADIIDVYLFFKEDGSDRVSDSQYVQTLTV